MDGAGQGLRHQASGGWPVAWVVVCWRRKIENESEVREREMIKTLDQNENDLECLDYMEGSPLKVDFQVLSNCPHKYLT